MGLGERGSFDGVELFQNASHDLLKQCYRSTNAHKRRRGTGCSAGICLQSPPQNKPLTLTKNQPLREMVETFCKERKFSVLLHGFDPIPKPVNSVKFYMGVLGLL